MKLLALLGGVLALNGAAPARLQVVAKEFSFTLSRLNLKAGPAVIELANFGQDPHNLRLQRAGSRQIAGIGAVGPGERGELSLRLLRGRYSFWCSVANHRKLGMRVTLVVR
ncbi:MAG: plastocyanin/azurin family copper-binding protein [Gaiellaceae bacterium]